MTAPSTAVQRNGAGSHRLYTPDEDLTVATRRYRGHPAKAIARDLGRTPSSVHNRFQALSRALEQAHGDVLARHREEELALMEKLIRELRAGEEL